MSEVEKANLETILSASEARMYEKLGRWVQRGAFAVIILLLSGAGMYYKLEGRATALETWKADRAQPIEEYYAERERLAQWQGRMETKVDSALEGIAKLEFAAGLRTQAELNDARERAKK